MADVATRRNDPARMGSRIGVRSAAFALLLLAACAGAWARQSAQPACQMPGPTLPGDAAILAAGGNGKALGFQIDQSGHEARQIDVVVNVTDKPVALLLATYEPTVWNVLWTPGTKIVAAYASGYHAQAIAGLPRDTPTLVSTYDNKGPCGYVYFDTERNEIGGVNPTARRIFGAPASMVYPTTREGRVYMGRPLAKEARLQTSADRPPGSYHDKNAPVAGPMGLAHAVSKGFLRKATKEDSDAWIAATAPQREARDVPPVAGGKAAAPAGIPLYNAYVVLKAFTYPAGLYGGNSAVFVIPKGVPAPRGSPGHSAVFDFNSLSCNGPTCR